MVGERTRLARYDWRLANRSGHLDRSSLLRRRFSSDGASVNNTKEA
jgi:hypothetical protein